MTNIQKQIPYNKGLIMGQKKPFKLSEIWELRTTFKIRNKLRDLVLLNLGLDSKLRSCDLLKLKVRDVLGSGGIKSRVQVIQQKTGDPVIFEITAQSRTALENLIQVQSLGYLDFVFKSRQWNGTHLSRRQYSRIIKNWVESIGLNPDNYGTHSMRRTKASLIYKKTGNLRAVQLLLGHKSLESTVKYLGVELDDALDISEHMDI